MKRQMNSDPMPPLNATFPGDDLFNWYDAHGRDLPWRHRWPALAPIYHLWLSEIMLQQTVVKTVIPYFLEFIGRWPRIEALASAPVDEVLAAWAGLGYYARARNLHKTAQIIAAEHGGIFPQDQKTLLELPGIGPYTASAIMVMGYGQPGVVVDGNIERVMSRFFAIKTPFPRAKKDIAVAYEQCCPETRPSDFPQALMDFASAVCTPKAPGCGICPLANACHGYANNMAEQLPFKAPKRQKPTRLGVVFVAINQDGEAFLERRPDEGLLGGMLGFPSAGWAQTDWSDAHTHAAESAAPFTADWRQLHEPVHHMFTHFTLKMTIYYAETERSLIGVNTGWWQVPQPSQLPSLMRKVWKQVETSKRLKSRPKKP
jgi:A/G-specific adenine glycosylase